MNWGRKAKNTGLAGVVGLAAVTGFVLNSRSIDVLNKTGPEIRAVAYCAATKDIKSKQGEKITFVAYHGFRTDEEQRKFIERAVTWVNRSRHQDGDAIDVMAVVNGTGTWEHPPYYEHAQAFYSCGQ